MSHFKHRLIIAGIFALIYGVLMGLFVGWRSDHTFMFGLVLIMLIAHKQSYKIVLSLSGFALFWIIYDALRIAPNYRFNEVHIKEPWAHADMRLTRMAMPISGSGRTNRFGRIGPCFSVVHCW